MNSTISFTSNNKTTVSFLASRVSRHYSTETADHVGAVLKDMAREVDATGKFSTSRANLVVEALKKPLAQPFRAEAEKDEIRTLIALIESSQAA